MRNFRLSPREGKFLEFYLGGLLMKDAARAAGYRGSPQCLCNAGRRILNKFNGIDIKALRANALKRRKIARLLSIYENSKSEREQSKVLLSMSKYLFGG